ncbi:MAG TPA: hypothetical protein DEP25_03380 [Candidatus Taylorbacteria bacterium]|nr:hypothetical protein [Candidatus Taylorbacteria bacterium]
MWKVLGTLSQTQPMLRLVTTGHLHPKFSWNGKEQDCRHLMTSLVFAVTVQFQQLLAIMEGKLVVQMLLAVQLPKGHGNGFQSSAAATVRG